MKLYHGGAASALRSMQTRGILPRVVSNAKSNWKHTVNSNRNAVYLTDAYAWHFAAHASDKFGKSTTQGIILEIDRDRLLPWLLCPDEDVLEQATRQRGPSKESPLLAPINLSMKERTMHYRRIAKNLSHLVDDSLDGMGTAAYYGTIPWSAVTRYVLIDWTKLNPSIHMQAIDSQVSTLNYRILQDRHRALTKWFFGDEVTPAEVAGAHEMSREERDNPRFADLVAHIDRQIAGYAKVMSAREGLEVHNGGAS